MRDLVSYQIVIERAQAKADWADTDFTLSDQTVPTVFVSRQVRRQHERQQRKNATRVDAALSPPDGRGGAR